MGENSKPAVSDLIDYLQGLERGSIVVAMDQNDITDMDAEYVDLSWWYANWAGESE